MPIYLYKKTHNITGLHYLGKTTKDPYVYKGSGVYWKKHIKKHGDDVTTEILAVCENNNEIRELGLYYSTLWNVKDNPMFANLISETGEGGDTWTGKNLSNETKKKISAAHKSKILSDVHKANLSIAGKHRTHPKNVKDKISKSNSIAMKGKRNLLGYRWWTNGIINTRAKTSPGLDWRIGKSLK